MHKRTVHIDCIEGDAGTGPEGGQLSRYRAALFVDNVFPLKISPFDIRPYLLLRNKASMRKKVESLLPDELPHGAAFSGVEPHSRDGGSIVYFTFIGPCEHEEARQVARELVDMVNAHVATCKSRRWLDFEPLRALPVQGVPFTEDIVRLLPSKRVRVEFNGPDLDVEQIFKEFRRFGRILDIEMQPSGSKDTPRWAIVHFTRLRGATSARNCVHGDVVGATKLALTYVRENREHVAIQWIKEHSKFTIPLAAAALIAAIYAVFDPIREFCVENKITHRFDLSRIPLLGNMRMDALRNLLRRDTGPTEEVSAWTGLTDQSERLVSILDEPPESFIVVTGPRGSGKSKVVEQAIEGKQYRIVIDSQKLATQHSELEQMTDLAHQLGWWPVFNGIISITNAIDLMVTATTGSNAGISATPESQVRRILETLALVLTNIRHDRVVKLNNEVQRNRKAQPGHARNKDSLDAPIKTVPPAEIPVIALDNFFDKDLKFAPVILDWAASVVEAGLAHCIVTTSSISGYHEIQRAQPQSAASLISLADASPMEAVTLLQQQLMPNASGGTNTVDNPEQYQHDMEAATNDSIVSVAQVLGGRREDLQLLVQKVKAGESVNAALEDIIQRSITEIRKYAFANDSEVGQHEHTWTPEQFWYLLTELARHEDAEYDRVRNSPLFAGMDDALLGLAEAQLITMVYNNDRPSRIRAGRPVYSTAFGRILDDPGFSSSMTVKMNKKFIEIETQKIRKAEEELALLNVFHASADSHSALMSSMAVIAASQGNYHRNHKCNSDGSLQPEAFIARAAGANGHSAALANSEKAQRRTWPWSWFGWLFGSGTRGRKAAAPASAGGSGDHTQYDAPPTVIPGLPHELQGRVQFLLQAIYKSQQKIDHWDHESRANAQRLADL
ncbi:mitochondrial escape protein 2 [Coemansia sp. RSA 552]|nr:mitochondrial escape protein 2 [Coemansia sp. RSA 552]